MDSLETLRSGKYKGAKRLKLCCGLTQLPKEIFQLSDSLEILDLSGNPLSELPDDISRLHRLKIAFFSDCQFTVFPKQLAQCPSLEMIAFKGNGMERIPEDSLPANLRWLILTNNAIKSLPQSIGYCRRLQKCMLAGNRLKSLPDEMANCKKLGLLRLSSNQITDLPHWLLELPELSFLAFAGNPCAPSFEDNPVLNDIAWSELSVRELLGEGASGIISKGIWGGEQEEKEVAVKLFKGEVTSDGSPADEMNACITAGSHPNLIDPIGKIHGHPERRGLVLQLIPPHFTNLGLPPTLQTCTRDSFHPDTTFRAEKCMMILHSIASAAAHLHAKGIAHGDLYAHNILIDDSGNALLGDFGAATIYRETHTHAEAIQRLEVLAFGHLIEDMLSLLEEEERKSLKALHGLHQRCTTSAVRERPSFADIHAEMRSIYV
ncbi:MAG: hypothetical protein M1818_005348 [Claussenomyces sp. TS43310]|nr:MAG: hypothetical protein M1818_005348 [Claussenomyces sp. TS43310]